MLGFWLDSLIAQEHAQSAILKVQHKLEQPGQSQADWEVYTGGVACNQLVKQRLGNLASITGLELVAPPPRLCTDNGVMVAWAGIER